MNRTAPTRALAAVALLAAATSLTGCQRTAAPAPPTTATTAPSGPTFAAVGEPAPTADTLEGLELNGTLHLVVENGTVCPVVEDQGARRSLVLPSDWSFAQGPARVLDQEGMQVLKDGDDMSKVVLSPSYAEGGRPCGGASEAVGIDGVSPRT